MTLLEIVTNSTKFNEFYHRETIIFLKFPF